MVLQTFLQAERFFPWGHRLLSRLLAIRAPFCDTALEERIRTWRMSGRRISPYDRFGSLTAIRRRNSEWQWIPVLLARSVPVRPDLAMHDSFPGRSRAESRGYRDFGQGAGTALSVSLTRDVPAVVGAFSVDGANTVRDARARVDAERAAAELAAWLAGEADTGPGLADRARTPSERELPLGSSFSLTAETAGKGFISMWGRGAATRFDGRGDAFSLDGEVTGAMLGSDWQRGTWTTGFLLVHSQGEGGYGGGDGRGAISATLAGLHPWLRHAFSDRLRPGAWRAPARAA